jgi:hypothetical protein
MCRRIESLVGNLDQVAEVAGGGGNRRGHACADGDHCEFRHRMGHGKPLPRMG